MNIITCPSFLFLERNNSIVSIDLNTTQGYLELIQLQ